MRGCAGACLLACLCNVLYKHNTQCVPIKIVTKDEKVTWAAWKADGEWLPTWRTTECSIGCGRVVGETKFDDFLDAPASHVCLPQLERVRCPHVIVLRKNSRGVHLTSKRHLRPGAHWQRCPPRRALAKQIKISDGVTSGVRLRSRLQRASAVGPCRASPSRDGSSLERPPTTASRP